VGRPCRRGRRLRRRHGRGRTLPALRRHEPTWTEPPRLAAEFSRLAKGKVAVRAATQALDEHDQQLLTQITAYAEADYGQAHEISYGGYSTCS
jgi:hypothetical protein